MTWDDFCDRYCDWSDSTVRSRISSLENVGSGEEVVDVALELADESIRAQLIRKAMRLGVKFTHDDFVNLDGEIPDAVYAEVAEHGGFYLDNPYFDENCFEWDDFYSECSVLPEDILLRCIPRIEKFGQSCEVADAIMSVQSPADDALYERAVCCGVRFTEQQMREMGRDDLLFVKEVKKIGDLTDEQINDFSKRVEDARISVHSYAENSRTPKKRKHSAKQAIGLGALIGIFSGLFGGKKRHSGKCDGDCANCPPHYGYRYGRWYYGHGHNYGCERGGNRGGGAN